MFSTVQTSILFYWDGKASAEAEDRQDPTMASENGNVASPLDSERVDSNLPALDAVTQEVRDQAEQVDSLESASELRPEDIDRGNEDLSKRTENSRTYKDGSAELVEITAEDTGYQDPTTGEVKDVDTSLDEDKEYIDDANKRKSFWQKLKFWDKPRAYKADGGPLDVSFPVLKNDEAIELNHSGNDLSMRPVGANSGVKPSHIDNEDGTKAVSYSDVWKGVDLVYEYHGDAVKEMIVLKERPNQASFEFEFDDDVHLNKLDNGIIEVLKQGEVQFIIPEISVTAAQKGPVSDSGGAYYVDGNRLYASVDWEWLNTLSEENYPVVIDPTINAHESADGISGGGAHYWSYKSDGYGCQTNCYQNVGWLEDNGRKVWQTMMRIPFDQALDKDLAYAQLNVQKVENTYGWYGTDANHRYWITWAPCFGFGCVSGGAPWIPMAITDHGWIDLTELIQWMKSNGQSGGWLMIHGDDSPYKALYPQGSKLSLIYNRRPSAPGLNSIANDSTQTTTMPRLGTNAASDPDGDALSYLFQVYDGDTLIAQSPWQSPTFWNVPEGILQDGGTYRWRVLVRDTFSAKNTTYTGSSVASEMRSFNINMRLGNNDKTQTYDKLGPISANLANGNVFTELETHSIEAEGGEIGLNLAYNTPQISQKGLTGYYYNDTPTKRMVMQRTDPNVHFGWGSSSPAPGVVDSDNFSVGWKGYFIAPKTGTYKFGGSIDDKMDFNIDPEGDGTFQRLFNYDCCGGPKWSSGTVQLEEGKAYRIDINYHEYTGSATSYVWVEAPGYHGQVIPHDWLRTMDFVPTNNKQGLRAEFFKDNDQSRQFKPNQQPYQVKNFNQVDLSWGSGSSSSYDPNGTFKDNFLVRFAGYITIPTAGNYKFGVHADDGKRLFINGNKVAEQWNTSLTDAWSGNFFYNKGDVVPVVVEYFEATGGAAVELRWEGVAGNGVIPSSALSTSFQDLPMGWDLGIDTDNSVVFERLREVAGGNVALISGDGVNHIYKRNGDSYKPPADEYGVLSKNGDGSYTFQDPSGQVYEFDVKGVLTRVTSPIDDRKPAALRYEYQDQSGVPRLKKIIDGIDAERWGELSYGGDSDCQTPSGFDAAPAGFLCAFKTYDGQISHFYYQNKQLARVETPGSALTDLSNDDKGRLVSVRGIAANDAIATGTRAESSELLTELSYDAIGRVKSVKGPASEPGAWRMEHAINYGFRKTKQHITGSAEPKGYSQYMEYDDIGRTTKACDQQALCTEQEWHLEKDLLLNTVDAQGNMSTNFYNDEDRVVEKYGPAPKEWFDTWDWILKSGQQLSKGQQLKSSDGRYKLVYQTDGNLVVRNAAGTATWASNTNGKASNRLVMQTDGNLVLYNNSTAVWNTQTGGDGDSTSYLYMQNNGNLVVWTKPINGGPTALWHLSKNDARVQTHSNSYGKPKAEYTSKIARTSTVYDEGIIGPEVVWYNFRSGSLHGEPLYRETGFDQADPSKFWTNSGSTSSPQVPVTPTGGAQNVGFRSTGEIKVPTTGEYTISLWHANAARVWVNDELVMDGWDYRSNNVTNKSAKVDLKNFASNKLKVEYANVGGGDTAFRLELSGNGVTTPSGVWGDKLKPGYGLVTSNIEHDAQVGNRKNTIRYGTRPEYGLAHDATVDPNGLNLTTSTQFEQPGQGYLRKTQATLPGNQAASFVYSRYSQAETRDDPCTTEVEAYRQGGREKTKTEADPDGSGPELPVVKETIYDDSGQPVAVRNNSDPWSCLTYDDRGRILTFVTPTINNRVGNTKTNNYAVDGNSLKSSVADGNGTIISETDLNGNVISYTDIHNNVTVSDYDDFGRLTTRTSPVGTESFAYDNYDRAIEYKLDNVTLSTTTYDQYGRMDSVNYPQAGQQALVGIGYGENQQSNSLTWRLGNGTEVTDQVVRSQSGLVTSNTTSSAGASSTWQYSYDAGQRLTQATLNGTSSYNYGFGTQDASCNGLANANPNAGKNSNRMSMTANGQATTYCYDHADRLIATSDPTMQNIQYDDHGNTVQLGNTTFSYDASNRNVGISETKPDSQNIEVNYLRDATDRVAGSQKEVDGVPAQTMRYGFTSSSDDPDFIKDADGNVVEAYVMLTGDMLLTIRPQETNQAAKQTYSLSNLHSDVFLTTDANGQNISTGSGPANSYQYDPFGQALTTTPDNTETGTFGWVGTAQKTTETDLTLAPIQMGARVYIAVLGRFLQRDSVDGGNENTYLYPANPIGNFDLEGKECTSFFGCAWEFMGKHADTIGAIAAGAGAAACIIFSAGICGAALLAGAAVSGVLAVAEARYSNKSWDRALTLGAVAVGADLLVGKFVDAGKVAMSINSMQQRIVPVFKATTVSYYSQQAATGIVRSYDQTVYNNRQSTQRSASSKPAPVVRYNAPINVCREVPRRPPVYDFRLTHWFLMPVRY